MNERAGYPDPYSLNYVEMLSFIEEVNRCPGGKRTISEILTKTHLSPGARILEIGSNTGFTSIEVARLMDCSVIGIDISAAAVTKAREILSREPEIVRRRVTFLEASAADIPFPRESFDLLIAGGANTFIAEQERRRALEEYRRVLRPYGFLSITNLYYHSPVPQDLLDRLSNTLGFRIQPWTRNFWLNLFIISGLELYHYQERMLQERPARILEEYVKALVGTSPALQAAPVKVLEAFESRWLEIMRVFNENHRYLAFMIVLLRNSPVAEQQEFFLEQGVLDPWNIDGPTLWSTEG